MSRLISVKDHQELKKDRIVGAVINCDKDAFATFIHKKKRYSERNASFFVYNRLKIVGKS